MKSLIIATAAVLGMTIWAQAQAVSNLITRVNPLPGKSLGEIFRKDTYRGPNRVYTLLKFDSDRNGTLDKAQEMFWINGHHLLSIAYDDRAKGVIFSSLGNLSANLVDLDKDGSPESITILRDETHVVDVFRRASDGFFVPIPEEELRQLQGHVDQRKPVVERVFDAIDGDTSPSNQRPEHTGVPPAAQP